MITQETIDRLRDLHAKATPAPWKLWAADVMYDPVGDSNLATAIEICTAFDRDDSGELVRPLRCFNAYLIAEVRTVLGDLLDLAQVGLELRTQSRPRAGK